VTGDTPNLDPQVGYTNDSDEADFMVYVPLVTYASKQGVAGSQLIPGLAEALPTISADQLTYTLRLRPGLTFSDGGPVVASDFTKAIERSIKIQWGGASFYAHIEGAAAYGAGKATSISGITTDDKTGTIRIQLTQPFGPFVNVLAFEASAPIPASTPMKALSVDPPLGVGPYTFGKVVPNVSYTLVRNPAFAKFRIPGIPTGYADTVDVTVDSNRETRAREVLDNTADIFEGAMPSDVLEQARSQPQRYQDVSTPSVYYYFLNVEVPPFDNKQARLAVNMAIDRTGLARLSDGALTPGCYFVPPGIPGHVDGPCPFGDPNKVPSAATVAKAKAMIAKAGLAGSKVTVWGPVGDPEQSADEYFTDLLNKLGFTASLKSLSSAVYYQTIGKHSVEPQVGIDSWQEDFPNPADFYFLLSKAGIQPVNSQNNGNVDDPYIEAKLAKLDEVPSTQLATVVPQWQNLERYVAKQADVAVLGYAATPKFTSDRVDFPSAVLSPVNSWEFSTVRLK
jgi:peptide/nickel transport system substrate-binding protein